MLRSIRPGLAWPVSSRTTWRHQARRHRRGCTEDFRPRHDGRMVREKANNMAVTRSVCSGRGIRAARVKGSARPRHDAVGLEPAGARRRIRRARISRPARNVDTCIAGGRCPRTGIPRRAGTAKVEPEPTAAIRRGIIRGMLPPRRAQGSASSTARVRLQERKSAATSGEPRVERLTLLRVILARRSPSPAGVRRRRWRSSRPRPIPLEHTPPT